jgi:tetratricopeptide (TPR) repeat protein
MIRSRIVPTLLLVLAFAGSGSSFVSRSHARAPRTGNPAASDVARAFQASYAAESSRKFDTALLALDALPAEKRGSYVVKLRRGWLSYLAGRSAESVVAYTQAIASEPDSVEPRLGLLLPQMALRRWTDVEKTAGEVLARDPGSYLGRMRLGLAQYSLGKFSEAEASYSRVLALHPSDVEARSGLAWALLKQRKKPAAIQHFTLVLELVPSHAAAKEGLEVAER